MPGISMPKRPIVSAFTATATEEVKTDISCVLKQQAPKIVVTGFDRENLYFDVETIKKKDDYVLEYIKKHPDDSGIIYCATRKNVDALYELLSGAGAPVTRYHAGMNNEDRKESQNDFIYDRTPVIVATNAFGMIQTEIGLSKGIVIVEKISKIGNTYTVLMYPPAVQKEIVDS